MLASKIAQYCAEKYGVPLCDRQGALNIVYIEGANLDGTPNADRLDEWNDVRYLVGMQGGKWEILFSQTATTEPGRFYTQNPMNKKGAARIGFGYHEPAWIEGLHKGIQPALVQRGPVRISRDANRDGKRNRKTEPEFASPPVGINHHSTNAKFDSDSIGRHSAGCLVGKDVILHINFIQILRSDPRRIHADQNKEAYLHDCWVIPGDDFGRFEVNPTTGNIQGPKEPEQIQEEMLQNPLFPTKGVKIKKGVDPIGTKHNIPTVANKEIVNLLYKVTYVSGASSWFASDKPIVYLVYAGGPSSHGIVPSHLTIPLEVFAKHALPVTKTDIFW